MNLRKDFRLHALSVGMFHGLILWGALQNPGAWWSFPALVVGSALNFCSLVTIADTERLRATWPMVATCKRCKGRGWITELGAEGIGLAGYSRERCPACGGKGGDS